MPPNEQPHSESSHPAIPPGAAGVASATPPSRASPPSPRPRKRRNILWKAILLSRARKRWRWTFRALIAIPLFLVAAVIVLTHSPLTRMLILPQIAAASGLNVDAATVHVNRNGVVVLDSAVFTIPGVPGEAGQFLRIARVEAEVHWWSTITGTPTIGQVTMTDPVLVVSESRDDGSLNLGSIPVPASGPGGMRLPGITARNVGLELGEHGKGGYKTLKRVQMDGSLTPSAGQPGLYTVTLYETMSRAGSRGGGQGFTLGGTVSDGRIELKLLNFSLSDWPPATLPSSVREISENMALSGEVSSARFTYTREEGITAGMDLKSVAMNLPLEASVEGPVYQPDGAPPAPKFMRMRDVNGTITFARDSVLAKVGGNIEDLPYQVTLKYHGVDEDSPFELDFVTRDFHMSRNPELLLYAPPVVKFYLKAFLMPTGIVTTNVHVNRGPPVPATESSPKQEGPITVSGSVDFREGTAAYETFPYEFHAMTGRFEFDNDQVRIVSVTGQSKTGARLHAMGRIGPLDETSEVDIHVAVTDAQIDEAMEAAFGPDRGAVIAALFNDKKHQELVDAGLVRTPEQAAAEARELEALELLEAEATDGAAARLAELRRRGGVPVFLFRGVADVTVHVFSPRGLNAPYQTSVDVFLPKVGLVPEKFPYPIVAENVSVEVRNKVGRIAFGTFRGLNGGRADVSAEFEVAGQSEAGGDSSPSIEIRAVDMPVDALLLHALPGESGSTSKRILRDLNIAAIGNGVVRIAARRTLEDGDEEPMGFDADIAVTEGEARPGAFAVDGKTRGRVAVAGLTGRLEASENELFLDLEGVPVQLIAAEAPEVGPPLPLLEHPRIGGTLTMHVDGKFAAEEPDPSFFVWASCPAFDLSSPFESLVGVFSADGAASVSRMRDDYSPSGFVNVRMEAETAPGRPRLQMKLSGARSLAAEFLGARALMPETDGSVTLEIDEANNASVRFNEVSGGLFYAGERAGFVSVDGAMGIGSAMSAKDVIEVSLMDGLLQCELTKRIIDQLEGQKPGEASVYSKFNPAGEFDARMELRPAEVGRGAGKGPFSIKGRIEPRSLTLRTGDMPVVFNSVGGALEFESGSGVLRALKLQAPEWSVQADGGWTLESDGRVVFSSTLNARGNKLSDDLRALLPAELVELFADLKLGVSGPFQLSDAHLHIVRGERASTRFEGRFDFVDASLEAGVPISNMSGAVLIQFDSAPKAAPGSAATASTGPAFRLDARADELQVAGITLSDGTARIESGTERGHLRVREASGMCHGGRFHVRAEVLPESADGPKRYNAQFQVAGVRFSTLLRELVDSITPFVGPPAPEDDELTPAERAAAQRAKLSEFSRGLLDAELTIEGPLADPVARRGRGTVRVSGGRVLNLPFMTGLIEAGNLQLPFNSSLDYAWVSMFIEGSLISFEDLSVQSRAIEISGGGTMTWPERELDIRLQTRSARPIPILSDIVQGIRHQFLETRVTGKLGEQVVGLQAPGPSRMLEGVLGKGMGEPTQRLPGGDRERDRSRKRGIRPDSSASGQTREDLAAEGRDSP